MNVCKRETPYQYICCQSRSTQCTAVSALSHTVDRNIYGHYCTGTTRKDVTGTIFSVKQDLCGCMSCRYRIYSRISRQFLAQFWCSSCGGRFIRGSCHTARVNSQYDGYLSAMLTVCDPHTAWTISRSLGLRGCVGESIGGVLNDRLQPVRQRY